LCVGKIAAFLHAFGLSVGLWGLANVLQCGRGFFLFSRVGKKNKINSLKFALTYQRAKFILISILSLSYQVFVVFLHLPLTFGGMCCRFSIAVARVFALVLVCSIYLFVTKLSA
jgi:hypothetical protein